MLKGQPSYDQGLFLMHLHRGKEYFDQNDLQKAREELEAAREMRPQDEKVLNILGMTYFKLEMLSEAEEMYDALASKNPDIYTLQSNLGLIQLKQDKLDEAERSLGRALELQPTNPKAHFYLGLLQEKKQDWGSALQHFEFARAEKMISKMRAKIEEERHKPEFILPFQVLDVIEVPETASPVDAIIEEAPSEAVAIIAEEEPFELPPVETSAEEPIFDMGEGESAEMQEPPTIKISGVELREAMEEVRGELARPDVLHFPQPPVLSEEEDELFEDRTPEVVDEPVEEVPVLSIMAEEKKKPWENTEPSLVLEEIEETEPDHDADSTINAEDRLTENRVTADPASEEQPASLLEDQPPVEQLSATEETMSEAATPAVQTDASFFLMEEMAADISTFLAQTRLQEESTKTENIFDEPPPMVIFGAESAEEIQSPVAEELFESRIPLPEEVENETQDIGAESLFEKESIPVQQETAEAEEPAAVLEPPIETPAVPEEPVLFPSEEPMVVEPEQEPQTEAEIFATQAMDVPEEIPESFADTQQSMETAIETESAPQEEPAAQSEEVLTQEEVLPPANLEQLSRERFYMQPVAGADRFILINPHLLQIVLSDKLICRTGTISSYTGNLQFGSWDLEYKENFPLAEVNGNGILFFADRRKELFILALNQETIYIEVNHLLVAQSALSLETHLMHDHPPAKPLAVLKASGRGTLALSSQTKPLTLRVQENLPVHVPADGLIAWSGNLQAEVIQDPALRKVLMSSAEDQSFLRFTGRGDVVVEQGSLSGDRRKKN